MQHTLTSLRLSVCCMALAMLASPQVLSQGQSAQDQGVLMMIEHLRNLERARPAPVPAPSPAPEMKQPSSEVPDGATVQVSEIRFSRSQLLSDADLRAIGQRYVGQRLASAGIRQLLRDVEQLYRDRGLLTAMPVLPRQDLNSGVLHILLVEGRLGDIRVSAHGAADPKWVQSWFDLPLGKVVTGEEVRERLALFNHVSDYAAKTQLVSGSQFGQTDLDVSIEDSARVTGWGFYERSSAPNAVVPSLRSVGMRVAPVSNVGGKLDLAVLETDSGQTFTGSLGIPLGVQGWRTHLGASVSRADSVLSVPIRTESRSVSWDVGKTWVLSAPWVFGTSVGLVRFHTRTEVDPVLESTTDRLSLAAQLTRETERERGVLRLSFNAGSSNHRYQFLEATGQWRRWLDDGGTWALRTSGVARFAARQSASTFDRLYLGGLDMVRGYEIGAASGDEGAVLQLELRRKTLLPANVAADLFVFADGGFAQEWGSHLKRYLGSIGAGLQSRINDHVGLEVMATHQVLSQTVSPNRLWMRLVISY